MSLFVAIAAIVAMTLIGAFFHLGEAAILSANFSRAKELEEDESKSAINLVDLRTDHKVGFNAVVRSASTISAFGAAVISLHYVFPWIQRWFCRAEILSYKVGSWLAMILLLLAVSSFYIICGQIIPRKIGMHKCEIIAYKLAGFMRFCLKLLTPYLFFIMGISNLMVKLFGVPAHADEKFATEDEIMMMVDASGEKGVIEEAEADMIANIFEFGDTTASEAMTHRTDVDALEYTSDVKTAVDFALENGFSRIPVYKDDLDNIQGVLYVKDLLKFVGNAEKCSTPVYEIMRPACYIPETKKLSELFGEMTETKVQMAVVVDEYGGTSGIITMEDLIESILGNIQDEFDNEDEEISQVNENTFTIDGTTSIYEVSDLLDIEIPEGDYDTLAGYIVSTLGRIPTDDEHPTINFEGYDFTVEQVSDRRVSRVHVVKNDSPRDEKKSDKSKDSEMEESAESK